MIEVDTFFDVVSPLSGRVLKVGETLEVQKDLPSDVVSLISGWVLKAG